MNHIDIRHHTFRLTTTLLPEGQKSLHTHGKTSRRRGLAAELGHQPVIAATRTDRALSAEAGRNPLEDRTVVVVKAAHQAVIDTIGHSCILQQGLHTIEVLTGLLAQEIRKAGRRFDNTLQVGILGIQDAQRIRVQAAQAILVEAILVLLEIGDQGCTMRCALLAATQGVDLQPDIVETQIVPLGEVSVDEGPRRGTTLEKMATLPTLVEGGRITAAMASQISDGAAAMLVMSEKAVKELGVTPRARIHHLSVRGDDPVFMLTAPIPATAYALEKAGMTLDDIDLVEINEAFAPVVLAWQQETGADMSKVNVNGGAIALGHPLGATGVRLMTTLLNELERTGGRYGLQTMCEGGGQANVTIIERL